jgi:hypothetical protein
VAVIPLEAWTKTLIENLLATNRDHVVHESRLELSRLLMADFDLAVKHIVAQPFLLRATVDSNVRRHVPDFPFITDDGPVVVDVKPAHRLADQRD